MHRISAIEAVIFTLWFLLVAFAIRYATVTLIDRDPDSRVGQALAFIH